MAFGKNCEQQLFNNCILPNNNLGNFFAKSRAFGAKAFQGCKINLIILAHFSSSRFVNFKTHAWKEHPFHGRKSHSSNRIYKVKLKVIKVLEVVGFL
jgi:hypothetical protein